MILPFSQFTDLLVQKIRERVIDKKKDIHIAIVGREGSGKSNLALWLAIKFFNAFRDCGYEFDIYKNVVFTETVFLNVFSKYKQIIVVDEAGAIFSSMSGRSKEQKEALTEVILGRVRQNICIYCVPNLRWFDPYFREHRLNFIIEMIDRTEAYAYLEHKDAYVNAIKERYKVTPDVHIVAIPFLGITGDIWEKYGTLKDILNTFYHVKRRLRQKNDYKTLYAMALFVEGMWDKLKSVIRDAYYELRLDLELQRKIEYLTRSDIWQILVSHFNLDAKTPQEVVTKFEEYEQILAKEL